MVTADPYRAPNPYDLGTWRRGGPDERADARAVGAGDRAEDELGATAGRARGQAPAGGEAARVDPVVAQALAEDPTAFGDRSAIADPSTLGNTGAAGDGDEPTDRIDPWDPPDLPRDLVDPFELARRTVNQSRAAARDRGLFPISAKTQARDLRDRSGSAPGYSGARPDPRDPQGIQNVLRRVLGSLGWEEGMSSGRVLEEWDQIVGEEIAAHCRPVSLDAGVLRVSASSSAWATQMRMLTPQIITRIHEHVGAAVISELTVTGPAAQSWKKGRRTVTWRGPRDTYG